MFEEKTDVNAGGDECYGEHIQGVPYQKLKHKLS